MSPENERAVSAILSAIACAEKVAIGTDRADLVELIRGRLQRMRAVLPAEEYRALCSAISSEIWPEGTKGQDHV
jgi:hypothetical protein